MLPKYLACETATEIFAEVLKRDGQNIDVLWYNIGMSAKDGPYPMFKCRETLPLIKLKNSGKLWYGFSTPESAAGFVAKTRARLQRRSES